MKPPRDAVQKLNGGPLFAASGAPVMGACPAPGGLAAADGRLRPTKEGLRSLRGPEFPFTYYSGNFAISKGKSESF